MCVFSVPGQWGQWGPWSGCSKKCGVGIRKRTRTCDSPAPLNNGPGCKGVSVDPKSCNQICPPVNGEWAEWQSWSSCSPDCLQVSYNWIKLIFQYSSIWTCYLQLFQFRRRECSNPKPKNGGRYCQGGRDSDSRNCTGGMCKRKFPIEKTQTNHVIADKHVFVISLSWRVEHNGVLRFKRRRWQQPIRSVSGKWWRCRRRRSDHRPHPLHWPRCGLHHISCRRPCHHQTVEEKGDRKSEPLRIHADSARYFCKYLGLLSLLLIKKTQTFAKYCLLPMLYRSFETHSHRFWYILISANSQYLKSQRVRTSDVCVNCKVYSLYQFASFG